jgi:hypothetical protein
VEVNLLLGGSGGGPIFTTPGIFLALLFVTLAIGIGIGIGKHAAVRRAKIEAEALSSSLRDIHSACRTKGHTYLQHSTGWRCATCGNYVSPDEGALYGLASDGRIERRRHPR